MSIRSENLALSLREFSKEQLVTAISNQTRAAEEGHQIFSGSFDSEILYGQDALDSMFHDLYLKELKLR